MTIDLQRESSQRIREEILTVVRAAKDPRTLTVEDIGALNAQWADAADASKVGARDGTPRIWRCTVTPAHGTWPAPPKDRSRSDRPSMCPRCSGAAPRSGELPAFERSVAAIAALAAELHPISGDAASISYGSNTPVTWWHQVPAVRPGTGEWYLTTHTWDQPPKSRTGMRAKDIKPVGINGCPVCNSDQADQSNSLASWYPELADQWVSGLGGRTPQNTPVGSKIEVTWRCIAGKGHRDWTAPPNRRTAKALRSGCELCSKNVSAKATALFHELRTHLPGLELEAPIPLAPLPGHRYRGARVDMWEEALRLIVEFDGWKTHGPDGPRDRSESDRAKTQRLTDAGQTVIRVREDLDPVGPHDVVVGAGWPSWKTALAVLNRIKALGLHPLPDLSSYAERGSDAAAADTENALLGKRYQPRRFPKPPKVAVGLRQLKDVPPHPNSWLAPAGPPYANPKKRAGSLRDYTCKCGTLVTGLRQAEVARGVPMSCGNHTAEFRAASHKRADPNLTKAARSWAKDAGVEVKNNGALNAQVLASYQLHAACLTKHLGPDSLIPQQAVEQWAAEQQIESKARGRLPRDAWLDFAASLLQERAR
ncbi:zinc-ribbon domain-containing protein [Streptomyces sp. BF23-18]|uniref:zinc-ribbon domain-containing protein n=1 Tax=Streptomyces sp. BF23-18 TaxID=3240282 RepID=UPI0034E51FB4